VYYCIQILNCSKFPIIIVIVIIVIFFFFVIIGIAVSCIVSIVIPYTITIMLADISSRPFIKSTLVIGNPWLPEFGARLALGTQTSAFT
jgi:hypothetical protein